MEDSSELEHLLSHYALGALCAFQRVEHGYVNETWIVDTTAGRHIVRRRHHCLARPRLVAAQHALIRHLRGAGFPAPHVCRTRHGSSYLELQGRLYEVHKFVPGERLDRITIEPREA
jgi:Ser/Thr protein kinase RdoA (MazF antagonist)